MSEPIDTLLVCCATVRQLVRRAVGFVDKDYEQDACEAMIAAVPKHDPDRGVPLAAYLRTVARYAVIDARRRRDGRVGGHAGRPDYKEHQLLPFVEWMETFSHEDDGYELVDTTIDNQARLDAARISLPKAVAGFSPRDAEIVDSWLHGETISELAVRHDEPSKVVTTVLARWRARVLTQGTGTQRRRAPRPHPHKPKDRNPDD